MFVCFLGRHKIYNSFVLILLLKTMKMLTDLDQYFRFFIGILLQEEFQTQHKTTVRLFALIIK